MKTDEEYLSDENLTKLFSKHNENYVLNYLERNVKHISFSDIQGIVLGYEARHGKGLPSLEELAHGRFDPNF